MDPVERSEEAIVLSTVMKLIPFLLLLVAAVITAPAADSKPMNDSKSATNATEKIVLGGGCFWCVEAVYQRLEGVKSVESGYAGGHVPNPTYKMIGYGDTGHAEVIRVEFDPKQISLDAVLKVFWAAHDPTTKNRQGNDVGPQYRSVILFANEAQKTAAEKSIKDAQKDFKNPIVTEVSPLKEFYKAEDYHQNYYNLNANKNPYCSVVIGPKLNKLIKAGVIKEKPVL